MQAKIYVASLSDYNAGRLHGAWIEATTDVDAMRKQVSAMLAQSKEDVAEEWAIHDYDDDTGALRLLGETSDLAAIAKRVALAEFAEDRLGVEGAEIVGDLLAYYGGDVDETREAIEDRFAGTFDSLEDWAAEFLEDTGALASVPENLRSYIDFEAYGRDARLNGDINVADLSGGRVAIFWST